MLPSERVHFPISILPAIVQKMTFQSWVISDNDAQSINHEVGSTPRWDPHTDIRSAALTEA